MPEFATTPIPYVPISEKAAEVRAAINAPQLSSDNSFGGLQKLAIPGPFATDTEASTGGVPDDNLYYRSDGTVRAASHISLDLAFALDKTLTARTGPTPVLTRSSTGTFIGSNGLIQSAAIDAARFDHDPITGVCKGLLIEEPRTNLVLQSEGFNTASWLKSSGLSITENSAMSPSGTTTADRMLPTTDNVFRRVLGGNITIAAASRFVMSVYAKADGYSKLALRESSQTGEFASFDLSSVSVLSTSVGVNASITPVGSGWFLITAAMTVGSGGLASLAIYPLSPSYVSGNPEVAWTPNGTSGILIWGAQLEVGAFPTSYIPTTVGTAARSADVCSITGSNFTSFYNNSAGTIVGNLVVNNIAEITPILFRSYLNEDNKIQLGVTNTTGAAIRPFIVSGAAQTYSSNQGTTTAGSSRKVSLAYAPNDAISCLNGTLGTQDTSVNPPTTVTFAEIGLGLTGTIASIQYFRKRLSNAKLQTITTL